MKEATKKIRPLRIILKNVGRLDRPLYNIIVTPRQKPKCIELVGQWDSVAKETPKPSTGSLLDLPGQARLERRLEWNRERIVYWLKQGAQPSKPVAHLLALDNLWNLPPKDTSNSSTSKDNGNQE